MKVLKFGGSSVANPERIKSVIDILLAYIEKEKIAVVFSAFGGVTDSLIQLSTMALAGDVGYKVQLEQLEKRHLEAVRELIDIQKQSSLIAQVKFTINELEDILHGIFLVKERTLRSLDYIMSFGERLSAHVIAEAINGRNIKSEFLDSRTIVRTDNNFGYAKIDFKKTNELIQEYFIRHTNLQVITGFIGSSASGETTTIGRSGSDYTAAIFAAALDATSLEIWTDVDGMMTADPRKVKKAFTVKEMTYEEAMELSHFGAKVIFPATMQPAMEKKIPICIKNTFNPTFPGSVISANANGKSLIIKGVSSMGNISLFNVQGSGLQGVVGVSMRLFGTLAKEKINVILISQASSEHSICFAIETSFSTQAKAAIEKEFHYEILNGEMDPIAVENDLTIVAIVGEGMKHNPGTSGRMFNALGRSGINVHAIAQGSSELNISVVIRQADTSKALNVLHEAFFLSDRKVLNVFLVGTGLIGKELVKMMDLQFAKLASQNHLEINLVGIANSKKMLFNADGITLMQAVDTMLKSGESMSLLAYYEKMESLNLSNSIFVDCTSSEEVAGFYDRILSSNISIVTPNKKANSGSLERYKKLKSTTAKRGVKFLYETNVGAGLPVINTLNDLLISGDKALRIEAVLSGTLNFIFSSFAEGMQFSEVVKEAKERGFTEPDPRDDLNGMDVARKALILAREIGLDLELSDIEVENLVPEECRSEMKVGEFFERLSSFNSDFDELRDHAQRKNEELRYMAILEGGKAKVSLASVGASHPFYTLSGSDNIILLTTERYKERPMVIRGPGAGAEVTAAGVFADVIRIGNYSN
ncbi:MAG: bifunctional aspartate kinase/homoserine dehydrogenase I [Cytophagales bacterium]|nr:bifunctional aspartate kinase/homoserine dehydrogenase I [Cytophagales bacterium]MCA6368906.1 bifunctional aspartate kinase/homoserine dehydrogenase I [Cytophagales bacterium]MCA6372787.1 bifunctional aspartate kinase/homoserine dehydrogenase I [Cytophagales bacterium]MCA6374389.1 bifunctional aspartate kinase/homoserine dehydrogenase I [Cytophagales bacterium]MCA6384494.1 bifunctional aspartate kinase/homoserine dehydrogenase I [Cytophagales bacterium]